MREKTPIIETEFEKFYISISRGLSIGRKLIKLGN